MCSEKYAQVAEALVIPPEGSMEQRARAGIHRNRSLSEEIGIPSNLQELQIPEAAIP